VSEKPAPAPQGPLERSVSPIWKRLAPLSVGAAASSAVIVGASAVLRRALGPRARVLGWASTVALLPLGLWLLARTEREPEPEGKAQPGELTPEELKPLVES
jgi:hypothetical protein